MKGETEQRGDGVSSRGFALEAPKKVLCSKTKRGLGGGGKRLTAKPSHRFQDSSPVGFSVSRESEELPARQTVRSGGWNYQGRLERERRGQGTEPGQGRTSAHQLWFNDSQSANHRLPARDNSARDCKDYSSLPGHSAGVFCFKGCFFPTHPKPTTRHKGDDDRWRTEKERGCSVRSRSMIIAVN